MKGWTALALLLVICAVGTAASAQPPVSRKSELQSRLARQPLTFFLVRGPEAACGPGCREWIAADGQFDEGAAARFRAFLARTGAHNVPVFFNSNGGLQDEAMAIGRILRERRMRAGVAVTRPDLCTRKPERRAVCDTAKKSGRPLEAEWTSFDARCNSACGIALIGAPGRWVPPGTTVGIHAPAYYCFLRSGRVVGRKERGRLAERCRQFNAEGSAQLARYAREMGVAPGFIAAMNKVPHTQVRYLTRDELVEFGIDNSGIAESPWMSGPDATGIALKLLDTTGTDGGRMSWLELRCGADGGPVMAFVRPGDGAERPDIDLAVGDRTLAFPADETPHSERQATPETTYLRRQMTLPMPDMAALVAQPRMELRVTSKAGTPEAATRVTRISNAGLPERWARISAQCAAAP